MQDSSISIRNLFKSFSAGNLLERVFGSHHASDKKVLHGISREIAAGEIFGLLGPDGAAFQKLSQGMKQRLSLARALLAAIGLPVSLFLFGMRWTRTSGSLGHF